MKFDIVVGNPPYQDGSGATGVGHTLWDKFVAKSFDLLKENGYLCMVHPSGWRGLGKANKVAGNLLKSKDMKYLELHNEADGLSVFGAETRYDWYVVHNVPANGTTIIKGQDGTSISMNISTMPFIPSGMFEEVKSLMAKIGEEKVSILSSESAYEIRKEWMSGERTENFKYPCVYSINVKGEPKFKYSSINTKGHFGIPKVIFASGRIISANYVVDSDGKYGMTQFARGIIDIPENLPKIAAAMRTDKFKRIMEMCALRYEISKDILATFRKDFWKEFVK